MRRVVLFAVVAIGLLGVGSAAVAQDVAKPLCADIINGEFGYTLDNRASFNFETVEPSCKGVTYTLHIQVDPGTVVTVSVRGNGSSLVQIMSAPLDDPDDQICVWGSSSRGGKEGMNQVFDLAPDAGQAGCVTLIPGGSGGGPSHG